MNSVRWFVHNLRRRHYRFEQGTTEFYICDPRWRWQRRPTEYAVTMGDNDPIVVTREQFVNLDRRLRAPGSDTALLALDEAIALLETDRDETTDDTEETDP